MIKKYKKTVTIEAIQFTGSNSSEIYKWAGKNAVWHNYSSCLYAIKRTMIANKGDYIVKGINGEYYPIKRDIFEATYEEIKKEDK